MILSLFTIAFHSRLAFASDIGTVGWSKTTDRAPRVDWVLFIFIFLHLVHPKANALSNIYAFAYTNDYILRSTFTLSPRQVEPFTSDAFQVVTRPGLVTNEAKAEGFFLFAVSTIERKPLAKEWAATKRSRILFAGSVSPNVALFILFTTHLHCHMLTPTAKHNIVF